MLDKRSEYMSKKVCVFGMDGFIVPMMKKFVKEGCLPNFERMLRQGTVNQLEPSFPVWTPTNWATLATGAHTGTHGASRWTVDLASNNRLDSFDGRAISAERIWNALERAGYKSGLIHYPAAYPSGLNAGFVIDGFAHPGYAHTDFEVAPCQSYTTGQVSKGIELEHDGTAVRGEQQKMVSIPKLKAAKGWKHLPHSRSTPLESAIQVLSKLGNDAHRFHLLVIDSNGKGYDRVRVCRDKDGRNCVVEVEASKWSHWAIETFKVNGKEKRGAVRFKLVELHPGGEHLKLYRSQITYTEGFTHPEELAAELLARFGPYQEHASMVPYHSHLADFDTALEECEYQGLWFADVANYLLYEKGCSFFTCHWHLYDYLNHICLNYVDPVCPGYDSKKEDQYMDYFRRAYRVGDHILGKLWEAADENTYVGVISDHGAFPDIRIANIRKFLFEKGFTVLKNGSESIEEDWASEEDIDWGKTRAYLKATKGFDIYINAQPGPEYDRIEAELLTALRTWTDEQTGRTPIAVALPKRDAYLLGQWGDQCGDIVFVWDHGYVSGYLAQWQKIVGGGSVGAPEVYGAHHGGFLPTQSDISSTFATLLLAGPGLKKGYERQVEKFGYIHTADVTPTLCHIFNVSPPAQSQGAVAYDLFEGHDLEFESSS